MPARLLAGRGAVWREEYRGRFLAEPGVYAAYAYDAAWRIVEAVRRAPSSDREAIRRSGDHFGGQWLSR